MDIEDLEIDHTDDAVIHKPKIKITVKQATLKINSQIHTHLPQQPEKPQKIVRSEVISASRRTDIPAFYMSLIIDAMTQGVIEVTGPYGVKSNVCLSLMMSSILFGGQKIIINGCNYMSDINQCLVNLHICLILHRLAMIPWSLVSNHHLKTDSNNWPNWPSYLDH